MKILTIPSMPPYWPDHQTMEKREHSPHNTPAVTGPLCKPNRIIRLLVSGPTIGHSNWRVMTPTWHKHSQAKRAMMSAWLACGSGTPITATYCFFCGEWWKTQESSEQSIRSGKMGRTLTKLQMVSILNSFHRLAILQQNLQQNKDLRRFVTRRS